MTVVLPYICNLTGLLTGLLNLEVSSLTPVEITKLLYAYRILRFGINVCLHLKLRHAFTAIMTHCFSNETELVAYKGCIKEKINGFSGSSITSGQAPRAKNDVLEYILRLNPCFVFIHYVLSFPVISVFFLRTFSSRNF